MKGHGLGIIGAGGRPDDMRRPGLRELFRPCGRINAPNVQRAIMLEVQSTENWIGKRARILELPLLRLGSTDAELVAGNARGSAVGSIDAELVREGEVFAGARWNVSSLVVKCSAKVYPKNNTL